MSTQRPMQRYLLHALTCSSRSRQSTSEQVRICARRAYSSAQAFKTPDLGGGGQPQPPKHNRPRSRFPPSSSSSSSSRSKSNSPKSQSWSQDSPHAHESSPRSTQSFGLKPDPSSQGSEQDSDLTPYYVPPGKTRKDFELYDAHADLFSTYLDTIFPPLQFPRELTERILTHGSHPSAIHGHNAQLSFVGRRVLESYLLLLLSSSPALREEHDLAYIASKVLNSNVLGQEVGVRKWNLGAVVRWTPAVEKEALDKARSFQEARGAELELLKGRGLYRVTGETVAAIFGGIYRQWGASTAHRTFHLHLLPHLIPHLPQIFADDVSRARDQVENSGLLNEKRAEGKKVLVEEFSE